VELKSKM